MATEKEDKEKRRIYDDLVSLTCGSYSPGDLSSEQQQETISILRCRLSRYKTDKKAQEKFGPLLPSDVLSQISKVPVEVVEAIADEFGLSLPKEIIFRDESNPTADEDIAQLLQKEEQKEKRDLFAGAQARNVIDYLEQILELAKSGKVHNLSVVAISNDQKVSLWIPEDFDDAMIQKYYSPIVDFLGQGPFKKPN